MPKLVLDGETHIYRQEGKIRPGISKILSRFHVGPNFNSAWFTNEARDLGTALHKGCEIINRDRELDWDTVDPRIKEGLMSYSQFLKDTQYRPVAVEEILYSEQYQFAGKLDVLLVGPEGKGPETYILADIKRNMAGPVTALQLAGYAILVAENYHVPLSSVKRFGLQNVGNGKPVLKPFESRDDFPVFKGLVNAYHWCNNNGLNKGERR